MSGKRLKFVVPGDFPPQIQGSPHLERLTPYGDVDLYLDRPQSMAEQLKRVEGAHVILNTRGAIKWFAPALQALPDLRLIATCSIGVDSIDVEAARAHGVAVANQPGRTAPVVAEHIIGLMFAAAKRAAFQTAELKAGRWTLKQNVMLRGKTLGVVGTGNVGREVARVANLLGMRCLAWTFNPSPERARELGVEFVAFDDLLRQSDVVSLHVRLSDESHHLIGARELGLMKRGAQSSSTPAGVTWWIPPPWLQRCSLSISRAPGLTCSTRSRCRPTHPILACEQVALTPHLADQTPEGIELLNEGIISNVIAFVEGRPQNIVT